jgi:hypothetical protein
MKANLICRSQEGWLTLAFLTYLLERICYLKLMLNRHLAR